MNQSIFDNVKVFAIVSTILICLSIGSLIGFVVGILVGGVIYG